MFWIRNKKMEHRKERIYKAMYIKKDNVNTLYLSTHTKKHHYENMSMQYTEIFKL